MRDPQAAASSQFPLLGGRQAKHHESGNHQGRNAPAATFVESVGEDGGIALRVMTPSE